MNEYEDAMKKTLDHFFEGIKSTLNEKTLGVLVSGGIDSLIIANYANRFFPKVTLLSFGVENNF